MWIPRVSAQSVLCRLHNPCEFFRYARNPFCAGYTIHLNSWDIRAILFVEVAESMGITLANKLLSCQFNSVGSCQLVLAKCIGVAASQLLCVASAHVVLWSFATRCFANRIGVHAPKLRRLVFDHVSRFWHVPFSCYVCFQIGFKIELFWLWRRDPVLEQVLGQRRAEMIWAWDEVRRADKSWDELRTCENSWEELCRCEKRREEMRWDERRWGDMRWGEESWEDRRWDEMRLEKITWVEMRRACMSSDEMSSDEMRKNQTLKRDVPGRRCQEIVAACCCKAQKACAHPIGTCFVPLYRL